jgi:hypothetical protein
LHEGRAGLKSLQDLLGRNLKLEAYV